MKIKVHTDLHIRVPMAAFDDPSLSRADFRVLTAICRQMNNKSDIATGITYDYLVKTSGSGKTTVCNSIKTLIERGYIVKSNKNGFKTANEYKVNFDITYEVDDTSLTGLNTNGTLVSDVQSGKEGATTALEAVKANKGEVTMHEVKGQERHWTVSDDNGTEEDHTEKRTSKKLTRPKKQDTTPVKEKTTRPKKQKAIFTRGYAASPTPLPPRGADVTEWSGYDGTALAERDGVRGKLKAGKRVYTILGKKYTFVMQDDGETVNFMASEPTANMLKYDILKYLKVPDYRKDQWKTIIDTLRRN